MAKTLPPIVVQNAGATDGRMRFVLTGGQVVHGYVDELSKAHAVAGVEHDWLEVHPEHATSNEPETAAITVAVDQIATVALAYRDEIPARKAPTGQRNGVGASRREGRPLPH